MRYKRTLGGLIWTDHAIERLHQRKLPQDIALLAFTAPDNQIPGKNPGSIELQKNYRNSLITLIVKKNERDEWIVISAWIDPPLPGTEDHRKQTYWKGMKRGGFWRRLWLTFKHQLGF